MRLFWREELTTVRLLLVLHDIKTRSAERGREEERRRVRDEEERMERELLRMGVGEEDGESNAPQVKVQKMREKRMKKKEQQRLQKKEEETKGSEFERQKKLFNKLLEEMRKSEGVVPSRFASLLLLLLMYTCIHVCLF
jgi:hypothetical protein